jgi:hypothetical protein
VNWKLRWKNLRNQFQHQKIFTKLRVIEENTMYNEKLIAIAKRAAWTFIQAFLAVFIANVTEGQAASEVPWGHIFEVALVAGILSVAKSFAVGIPEAAQVELREVDEDE